jgi:hypothetical protein
MSRFTSIAILVLVAFLTIGAAVALAEVVTTDDSRVGGEEDGTHTCPMNNDGDEGAMREHHEAIHGEGSWEDMPMGECTEEMREEMGQHHDMIHGEGGCEDMPAAGSTEDMKEHHESMHGEGSWEGMEGLCPTAEGQQA